MSHRYHPVRGLVPTLTERLSKTARGSVAGCARCSAGFTLIEVLVVASITVIITGLLISNFSRSRTDLNQSVLLTIDAIRETQSLALSGTVVRGIHRCGYGIHFSATGYVIFAGPDSDAVDCTAQSRTYEAGDDIIRQALLGNAALEYASPFVDIFFEPPDPTTYLGGSSTPGNTLTISLRQKGAACPSRDCRSIMVTTSGRIEQQ